MRISVLHCIDSANGQLAFNASQICWLIMVVTCWCFLSYVVSCDNEKCQWVDARNVIKMRVYMLWCRVYMQCAACIKEMC